MDDISIMVHKELHRYLLELVDTAETIARTHPEITLMQFVAVMRAGMADSNENWSIDKFVGEI